MLLFNIQLKLYQNGICRTFKLITEVPALHTFNHMHGFTDNHYHGCSLDRFQFCYFIYMAKSE